MRTAELSFTDGFYSRDANASADICDGNFVCASVCLCVCLCVTRVLCIKTAAWIELIFCMPVSLDLRYNVFERKLGYLQK